jgi:hypothetical protein
MGDDGSRLEYSGLNMLKPFGIHKQAAILGSSPYPQFLPRCIREDTARSQGGGLSWTDSSRGIPIKWRFSWENHRKIMGKSQKMFYKSGKIIGKS